MEIRRRTTAVATALAVAICAVAVSQAHAGSEKRKRPKVEFKIASLTPEGSTWSNFMRQMDEEIYAATEGTVGCRFYFGGVAGDEKDVLRKIRIGQMHGGAFSGIGLGTIVPDVRVMEMPFTLKTYDEVDFVYDRLRPDFEKAYKEAGFELLGAAEQGYVYMMSANDIRTVDDVRHSKVWLWEGDPLAEAIFAAFHITPISLAVPDVLTSLQTNLIDTVYISPLGAVALQWFTKVKYIVDFPITNGTGAVIVSSKQWRRVPERYRPVVKKIVEQRSAELRAATRRENDEAMRTMVKNDLILRKPAADQIAGFERVGVDASRALVGKLYSKGIYDKAMAALSEFRNRKPAP